MVKKLFLFFEYIDEKLMCNTCLIRQNWHLTMYINVYTLGLIGVHHGCTSRFLAGCGCVETIIIRKSFEFKFICVEF